MLKLIILAIGLAFTNLSVGNENHDKITVISTNLNGPRDILVRLPSDYDTDSEKRYPILFTLNDEDNFSWASYIVELQASRFGIQDMIVVGLPHNGEYTRDNYPFISKESIDLNPQSQNHANFIISEVIPLIDKKYRTNKGRFIAGHSISGLFVAQLFMQHHSVFSSFFILSPSLQHAPQMEGALAAFFKENPGLVSQIYLSIGALEHQKTQQAYSGVENIFETKAPEGLKWSVTYMQNTDHLLAAFNGTYDALKWVYADYALVDKKLENMKVGEIIQHYRDFSNRMKYEIKPRLRYMTGFAYFIAKETNNIEAGLRALRTAEHFYPNSPDIVKSLKQINMLEIK